MVGSFNVSCHNSCTFLSPSVFSVIKLPFRVVDKRYGVVGVPRNVIYIEFDLLSTCLHCSHLNQIGSDSPEHILHKNKEIKIFNEKVLLTYSCRTSVKNDGERSFTSL